MRSSSFAVVCLVASAAFVPPAYAEEPPPKTLSVGTSGFFQPGLLIQTWFFGEYQQPTTITTFRIRRAEIHVKGDILPDKLTYGVMVDPARVLEFTDSTLAVTGPPATAAGQVVAKQPVSPVSVLQDVFLTYKFEYVDITAGQFKIPVSWEGFNSSAKLLFPERDLIARTFGDRRDIGIRLAKSFKYFYYNAGLYNGSALDALDTNNAKDAAIRLEVYPVSGMTIGGVAYASIGNRLEENMRDRLELDFRYEHGPFLFQSEYIRARDRAKKGLETDSQGFYAAVAYVIGNFQPCVRGGYLDPDTLRDLDPIVDKGRDEAWHVDLGINYLIRKFEANVKFSYSRIQYQKKLPDNQFILAAQASF